LPRDAGTYVLVARVCRRLGRLDEAQAACDRVLALEPDDGTARGIAAALALDRDELERARDLIQKALAAAPGDAYLLVVRAEIALAAGSLDEARAQVAAALSAVRNNPLVFLQTDASQIERKLAERDESPSILSAADPVV
jgi:predicted Zn-dependent protease